MSTPLEVAANAANSLDVPAAGLPDADVATRGPPKGANVNSEANQLGYWSELEVESLKAAVESLQVDGRLDVDWLKVSELVPSRSAKQCRQVHEGKERGCTLFRYPCSKAKSIHRRLHNPLLYSQAEISEPLQGWH